MATLSLTEAMIGREKAVLVDTGTVTALNTHPVVYETYGARGQASADAERHVSKLPGVETGRYGIDVSIFCAYCHTFHSEESDCAA